MTLIGFVLLYILVTIAIGIWAATRVKDTNDFALAGRSLPLPMVVTATFATWFGSETILGLPGRFIESGIAGVIEEPFGSGMALILVGTFLRRSSIATTSLRSATFTETVMGLVLRCSAPSPSSFRILVGLALKSQHSVLCSISLPKA